MAVIYRTREDLQSQRAAAVDDVASSALKDRSLGVLAGLDWALGLVPVAPVTGRPLVQISLDDIRSEHAVVDEIVSRRSEPVGRSLDWYGGLDHTLLWLISDTTPRPMTTSDVATKPGGVVAATLATLRARRQSPEVTANEAVRLGGAIAALAWVQGEVRSPVTDDRAIAGGPTPEQIDAEAIASDDQRNASSRPAGDAWLHLCAVDDALSWVLDDTAVPFIL